MLPKAFSTIRLVLSLSSQYDYELENTDVDTALLQSKVDQDNYVQQPVVLKRRDQRGNY